MTKRSRDSPNKDKLLSKQRRPNDVENIRPYEMKGKVALLLEIQNMIDQHLSSH